MHALLVAALLATPDMKPLVMEKPAVKPLVLEKPDDVDLGPDEPTHRREGIEGISPDQVRVFVEALNGKQGNGGFGQPGQAVFTMDLTLTRAGFWSPTGGITYGPVHGTFSGGFGSGGGGRIRPGGFGGSGGGRGLGGGGRGGR